MKKLLIVLLLISCGESDDYELTCQGRVDFLNHVYNNKIRNLYESCPDKCDMTGEIKILRKELSEKIENLDCN